MSAFGGITTKLRVEEKALKKRLSAIQKALRAFKTLDGRTGRRKKKAKKSS